MDTTSTSPDLRPEACASPFNIVPFTADPTTPTHAALPLPESTPIKLKSSTTCPFTTNQKYRVESCTAMGQEIKKYLVGPMPAQEFLDDFFPVGELPGLDPVPQFVSNCYCQTIKCKKETKAYAPFIRTSQNFTPALKFVNSSLTVDCNSLSDFPFKIKPDISVYRDDSDPNIITDSASVELFIEFKWNSKDNPFGDVHDVERVVDGVTLSVQSFLHETKGADDTLGQITAYAAAQLGSQFCTHVYSVLIVKNKARILRWDRLGTIVMEAIEYNKTPHLAEFFRRYSHASPAMHGVDQSVSDPTPAEAAAARELLGLDDTVPLAKFKIPRAGSASDYFVTTTPKATPYTPPGRATRVFHAYDIARKAVVLLKDSWRVNLPDIQAEGKTYDVLMKASVRNIPRCLASGDITTNTYHSTITKDYTAAPWACYAGAHFIPHHHYRLALDIIGRNLVKFESSYEMVTAIRDALIALMDAYRAGILHCDFSPGNIIIIFGGRGLLIDWDLSKPLSMEPETPGRATRTGFWQFMSSKLISQQKWQHDFQDDLESSIYVLLWVTLMYSGCSDVEHVVPFMEGVLDPQPHGRKGGLGKADFLQGRSFLKQVNFPNQAALHNLLNQLAHLFAVRYETAPDSNAQENFQQLLVLAQNRPDQLKVIHKQSAVASYDLRTYALTGHEATIELFNKALADYSQWPAADRAMKQNIYAQTHSPRPALPTLKSDWSTTLIMHEIDANYEIIDDEMSLETTDSDESFDSDQMTVDDHSPTRPSVDLKL